MIKNNNGGIDPAVKQAMKNKIRGEIEKMKVAEAKGDTQAMQKIMILNERIRLIDSYRPFDETRITSLQKVFKHYCTHTSMTNKRNMTFDRIVYENEHLTIERFFLFIHDFKLNQIPTEEGNKQLTDRNKIILLFKKSSENSRNLSFPEFIICLQRLFVLLFTQTENYDKKLQQMSEQKKKRLEQLRKREEKKQEKLKKKNKQKNNQKEGQEGEEQQSEEEGESEEDEQGGKNTENANNQLDSSKPAEVQSAIKGPEVPKSTENDQMVKDMMKNFQIVNPTDEVAKAVKAVKKGKEKQEDDQEVQIEIQFDPYAISDQQKIESYMLRMGVDNFKSMEKKMRYFQKANIRHNEGDPLDKAMQVKKQKLKILKKDSLTHYENAAMHQEWSANKKASEEKRTKRLLNIREIITERDLEKSKALLAEVLPKQAYDRKKHRLNESFRQRQRDHMDSLALSRLTKLKEHDDESSIRYSLEMVSKSTPNQLPFNKINPEKFISHDPTDRIFLQQFGSDFDVPYKGRYHHRGGDLSLVESIKRRAQEIEYQESKRLDQISQNRLKNQHYLQKFLERRW